MKTGSPADNIINKEYYEKAYLSHEIRSGAIKMPIIKHNDYTDYSFSREDAIHARLRYLRDQKHETEVDLQFYVKDLFNNYNWFSENNFLICQRKVNRLIKDIEFNRSRLKYQEDVNTKYNIETIKRVPLDNVTKILSNGFFEVNPFRKENSPSNSLHWDKKSNRWFDFGSGQHGDVIDLYQAIYQCDLKTALKELSKL